MTGQMGMTLPVSMTLTEVRASLDAVVLGNSTSMDSSVERAFSADLMSDVLAYSVSNSLLITGLTSAQAIRTAEFANIIAVIFVRGKRPDPETIELANRSGILLLSTPLGMFETCGRLYTLGLRGGSTLVVKQPDGL